MQLVRWEFAEATLNAPSDEFGDVTKLRKAGYEGQVWLSPSGPLLPHMFPSHVSQHLLPPSPAAAQGIMRQYFCAVAIFHASHVLSGQAFACRPGSGCVAILVRVPEVR